MVVLRFETCPVGYTCVTELSSFGPVVYPNKVRTCVVSEVVALLLFALVSEKVFRSLSHLLACGSSTVEVRVLNLFLMKLNKSDLQIQTVCCACVWFFCAHYIYIHIYIYSNISHGAFRLSAKAVNLTAPRWTLQLLYDIYHIGHVFLWNIKSFSLFVEVVFR